MKPKVLHIIDHTEEGGAQVVVRQLIENLGNEFAFSVAVLGRSGRFTGTYQTLGVRVLELGNASSRWNPFSFLKLIQILRREDYDLAHTHLLKSNIIGALAARFTRSKIILHDHSSINPYFLKFYFRSLLLRCIYLLLYRLVLLICHRLIVLTPSARANYHETYAVDFKKIAIVPNGVSFQQMPTAKSHAARSIRSDLRLTADTRLVIMVARLEPEKDWITFLKVVEYVPKLTKIKCGFLVIGVGSQEQRLRNYVAKNNLETVCFLGYRNDVFHLVSDADVFLLTSEIEPFGIVLLEAMMIGCPVVATRSGGPESIVTDGFNGLLAEVGDVQTLGKHVVRILENDTLRADLIENARKTVMQSYSVLNSTSRVADIYKQVLREKKTLSF